ncbi:MAG: sulfur carrier protein ThiS [Parashewanella sp.]
MITVSINDQAYTFVDNISINEAVLHSISNNKSLISKNMNAIALALNGQVLPRKQWAELLCKPNDKINVFTAVAGG